MDSDEIARDGKGRARWGKEQIVHVWLEMKCVARWKGDGGVMDGKEMNDERKVRQQVEGVPRSEPGGRFLVYFLLWNSVLASPTLARACDVLCSFWPDVLRRCSV